MIHCVGTSFVVSVFVVVVVVVAVVDDVVVGLLAYSEYLVDCFCWC